MRLESLTENKFNIDVFRETAMKMWVSKYKREYNGNGKLTFTDKIIYLDQGVGKVKLLEFERNQLTFSGFEGEESVKYGSDELKFIRAIQKAAKSSDTRPLKNLKALRDNIELRDFDKYLKHEPFFKKLQNLVMKYRHDTPPIYKHLKLVSKQKSTSSIGDTVYAFDLGEISVSTAPIMKIDKVDIYEFNDRTSWRINDGEYDLDDCFASKEDAELAFLYQNWGRGAYLMDSSRLSTKNDKVNYTKLMIQYEKWYKKFKKQFDELDRRL